MARAERIFTIGYEDHRDPRSLVSTLSEAGVQRVVDVRELPLSRRRGFSKTGLAAALGDANIDYVHDRRLGNPKRYRELYKTGHVGRGESAYRRHLTSNAMDAVHSLAGTLRDAKTCLLCLEDDPRVCHRSVIVEALKSEMPGLAVVNL
jgi:uncharacterized protein (DUF488 family)